MLPLMSGFASVALIAPGRGGRGIAGGGDGNVATDEDLRRLLLLLELEFER